MQVGSDGGRHGWFKWANGPVPEAKSLTQSISLYDCTLVTMKSLVGTPDFDWTEENPNSDRCTRVLGELISCCSGMKNFNVFLCRGYHGRGDRQGAVECLALAAEEAGDAQGGVLCRVQQRRVCFPARVCR